LFVLAERVRAEFQNPVMMDREEMGSAENEACEE
jgi:hypothetical protein